MMHAVAHRAAPGPATADGTDWLEIPRLMGVLLWRHWPQLLFWFFAQRVAYFLLMQLAIALGARSALLSMAAVAVLVVTQLVGTIGMFMAVRPSLGLPRHVPAPDAPERPWFNALTLALLPFFAYYAAWGLLEGIWSDFRIGFFRNLGFVSRENPANVMALKGVWVAFALAWAIRAVAHRQLARTGSGAWAVVATVCDAYWVFVGVAVIAKLVGRARDWWHARVAYEAVVHWWQNPFVGWISLQPLKRVVDPLLDIALTLAGAVSMPLVWLAITALIYGLDLRRRQRLGMADARLRYAARRYARLHAGWHMLADKATAGWNSKGVPVLNSLRLTLRAGLPALLTLCLGWQVLAFLDAAAPLAVVKLLGAHSPIEWNLIGQQYTLLFPGVYNLRPGLLAEVLRVVLLAATFSCALARLQARDATPPAGSG